MNSHISHHVSSMNFFKEIVLVMGEACSEQLAILNAQMDEVSCWNCALVIASQPHEKRMFPTVSHFHNPYSTIFPSSSFPQNSFTKKKKKHFSVVKSQTTLTWIETMNRSHTFIFYNLKNKDYTLLYYYTLYTTTFLVLA